MAGQCLQNTNNSSPKAIAVRFRVSIYLCQTGAYFASFSEESLSGMLGILKPKYWRQKCECLHKWPAMFANGPVIFKTGKDFKSGLWGWSMPEGMWGGKRDRPHLRAFWRRVSPTPASPLQHRHCPPSHCGKCTTEKLTPSTDPKKDSPFNKEASEPRPPPKGSPMVPSPKKVIEKNLGRLCNEPKQRGMRMYCGGKCWFFGGVCNRKKSGKILNHGETIKAIIEKRHYFIIQHHK